MRSERDSESILRRQLEQLGMDVELSLENGPGWLVVHFKVHLQLHHKLDLPIKTIGGSSGWKREKRGAERVGLRVDSQTPVGATCDGRRTVNRERNRLVNGAIGSPPSASPETVFTGEKH